MDRNALFRMLYLRREYTALLDNIAEFQGLVFVPERATVDGHDKYSGIIFIRSERSPWHKGAFAFTVLFPPRYPFECPVAEFDMPLDSHPLIRHSSANHRRIPFDVEYDAFPDPMKVSIMLRLLKFIRFLFVPQEWKLTGAESYRLDLAKCQDDVERRSVAQEVVLSKPYVSYLADDVRQWLLETHNPPAPSSPQTGAVVVNPGASGTEAAALGFASWFTQSFLRTVTALP